MAPLRQAARNSAGRNANSDSIVAQLQSTVRHRETPTNRLLDAWLTKLLLDASEPYGRVSGAGATVVATRVLPPGFVTSSYYDDYCAYVAGVAGAAAAAAAAVGASLTQYKRRVSIIMDLHAVKRRTAHGTHVFCDCCTAWHGARASAAASGDEARGARLLAEHRAHLRCIAAEHQLGQLFAALAVDCTRTDRPSDSAAAAPPFAAAVPPLAAAAAAPAPLVPPAPAGPGAAGAAQLAPAVSLSYFIIDRPSTTPMVKELRASKSWAHSKDFIFSGQGIYSAAGGGAAAAEPRVSINYSTRIFVLGANKTTDALVRELLLLSVDGLPRTIVINCDNSAAEVRYGRGFFSFIFFKTKLFIVNSHFSFFLPRYII